MARKNSTPPGTDHKLPALHFYVGDWRKDPGIQGLDYESRGVWWEMLLMMHESGDRGKLLLCGKAMPIEALAQNLGIGVEKTKQIVSKIEAYGVASRDQETGALICRRMVREELVRLAKVAAGRKGGLVSRPLNPEAEAKQKRSTPQSEIEANGGSSVAVSVSSSVSSPSLRSVEPGAHARELATYLGEHAHLIDDAAGRANGSCETWALALLGLYVGSGDRAPAEERMLQPIPKEDRPALLATALLRFIGEDQAWDGKFFRGIMRKCVGEHVRGGVEGPDFGDEGERDADRAAEARNRASTAAMDESRKAGQAADVALAERREWLDSLDEGERNTVAAEIDKRARQIQPTGKLTRMVIDACLAAVYEERAEVSP